MVERSQNLWPYGIYVIKSHEEQSKQESHAVAQKLSNSAVNFDR